MQLIVSEVELIFKTSDYLLCNASLYNIDNLLATIKNQILSNNVTDIFILTPLVNLAKIYNIAQFLYNNGIFNVYKAIFHDGYIINIGSIWNEKPILDNLEYEVTNKCNLKCKGCSHFSNLEENDDSSGIDIYTRDIKILSQKYFNVRQITLLGGEPLIVQNLKDYILVTHKYFPDSIIRIFTNGLLLKSISNELLITICQLKVKIIVSLYPQFKHIKEEIICWAKENAVDIDIRNVYMFFKYMENIGSSKEQYTNPTDCSRHCNLLLDGKLSWCPMPLVIHRINNKFGTKYPTDDYIDINSNSSWEINKFLSSKRKETKLCNYCLQKPEKFLCKQVESISLNDWVST